MDNYVAIVFDSDEKAFQGLHALWNLDTACDITTHGAAAGIAGAASVAVKSSEHDEAAYETEFTLKPGEAAVIAEVSEDWTTPIDAAMKQLGGTIYRRTKGAVRDNSIFDDYTDHLYAYDYQPHFKAS